MKHLILGASGQVGQYITERLIEEKQLVLTWDITEDSQYDLRDRSNRLLENAISQSDFVHFLAFDVGGSTYLQRYQDTFEFVDNNVKIMDNVFNLLRKYDKPFYFASSQMSNMYDSVYGRLKAVGEAYTKSIGGINVQFWNVYGYERDENKSHVLTDFIDMAMTTHKILVRTTGEEKRSFTFAADAAKMLHHITASYDTLIDAIYNYSLNEWGDAGSITYEINPQPRVTYLSGSGEAAEGSSWTISADTASIIHRQRAGGSGTKENAPMSQTKTVRNNLWNLSGLPITSGDWITIKDLAYVVAEVVGELLDGVKIEVFVGDKKDSLQDRVNEISPMIVENLNTVIGLDNFRFTKIKDGVRKVATQMMNDYEFTNDE